ncbi:hypothetical protein KAR91_30465 [Candidatus Pacearchaeota archaeon]|nr:hypothetical protein [Candidatus Pacearchaeota archaeon]
MSDEKRFIPRSPSGKSLEGLGADTRHQAIANIKAKYPVEGKEHWKELQKEGWVVIDTSGPPQFEMY